jgi:hypothetical protein
MNSVKLFLAVSLACAMLLASGCRQISALATLLAPPKKVKPVFVPPKDKILLVFVDDMLNPVSYEPAKRRLTEQLNKQLVEHKVVAKTVPYERMLEFMSRTPKFNSLSVSEIGRKLDADLVLYIQVNQFSLKDIEESPLWHGRMHVTVRVVDVAKARTLWPTDRAAGMPLDPVEIPEVENPSTTYAGHLARQIADEMADQIAKLFYEYTVDTNEGFMSSKPKAKE